MNMVGFADEETYNKIVEVLGYTPDNLTMNWHMPKVKVVLADLEALSKYLDWSRHYHETCKSEM